MKNVITKIGEVEVTPGVAQFLHHMLRLDLDTCAVKGYIDDLL